MSKFSHKHSYRLAFIPRLPRGLFVFLIMKSCLSFYIKALLILECPFPCLFFLIVLDPLLKALEHQIKICFPLLFSPLRPQQWAKPANSKEFRILMIVWCFFFSTVLQYHGSPAYLLCCADLQYRGRWTASAPPLRVKLHTFWWAVVTHMPMISWCFFFWRAAHHVKYHIVSSILGQIF